MKSLSDVSLPGVAMQRTLNECFSVKNYSNRRHTQIFTSLYYVMMCSYELLVETLLLKEEFHTIMESIKPAIDAIILTARGNISVIT